jgi:prepilin-type N-terminal cleavage/methylation domain-containing protein
MKKNKSLEPQFLAGFTVIEILVVIAIIGVLGSIVLSYAGSYKAKNIKAAVKANMASIPAGATLHYINNDGSYLDFCNSSYMTNVSGAIAKVSTLIGTLTCQVSANNNAWCACSQVSWPNSNLYFCIDSTGTKKEQSSFSCESNGGDACNSVAGTAVCK